MIDVTNKTNEDLVNALKSGDQGQAAQALAAWQKGVEDSLRADFENYQATNDVAILNKRGIHTLTSAENKFYDALAENIRDKKPMNAASVAAALPLTIIEDVIGTITQDHPLIAALNPTLVSAVTRTIEDASDAQLAVWGDITDAVTKEITASLKADDKALQKLSCFLLLSEDYLTLGPTWIDAYVREVLAEALSCGIENGAINGTGVKMPIGLIKDIHSGVTVSTETGYPDKTAVAVTSFDPKSYGALLATMAKKENGRTRKIAKVYLVVNPADYFSKVMPATTVMTAGGAYVGNVFPFPTDVIQSTEIAAGKAVIFAENEYKFNIATSVSGNLEFSDQYKFLEDFRTYKLKLLGNGKAKDNTSAIYLDISGLTPAYVTVKEVAAA